MKVGGAAVRRARLKDGDVVSMSGLEITFVGQLGWELLRDSGLAPAAVGGLTMGADPVAYAIAHTSWLAGDPKDSWPAVCTPAICTRTGPLRLSCRAGSFGPRAERWRPRYERAPRRGGGRARRPRVVDG